MTTEEYAEQKGIEIVGENPADVGRTEGGGRMGREGSSCTMARRTKSTEDLLAEIDDLQETVDELQGQLNDITDIVAPEEEEAEEEGEDDNDSGYSAEPGYQTFHPIRASSRSDAADMMRQKHNAVTTLTAREWDTRCLRAVSPMPPEMIAYQVREQARLEARGDWGNAAISNAWLSGAFMSQQDFIAGREMRIEFIERMEKALQPQSPKAS